jgi:D-galactarolactone cycloisomerase
VRIAKIECFAVTHHLDPRTGPSIAYSSEHGYVLLKLTDADGTIGWGETYRTTGVLAMVGDVASSLIGVDGSLRMLLRQARWSAGGLEGGGFAASAISIALEDLAARQLGISVARMYGGPVRHDVERYAASGGYVEGRRPAETWFDELARIREAGYTAMKWRIGRYPIEEETPLLERLRSETPDDFQFMADGNAAYTFGEAVKMGRVMESLGFRWYEEPMEQRGRYVGYERLNQMLDVPLAGGEALMTRSDAELLFARHAVDIVQPDPVICGGVGEVVWLSELATLHGITTTPHTSNSAIGIAAALQAIACMPDRTRSPATSEPLLEYGVDDSPWRESLLATPHEVHNGRITIPNGPGLGIEIDEEHVRAVAIESRVEVARS